MKQPQPSGQSKGENIFLKDVLSHFDDFRIKMPIAWIVGGMAVNGVSPNDIDILINLPPDECDSSVARVIRFRIQRSLPQKYWDKIHWLYNDGVGPFTSCIPLFSLEAKVLPFTRQEMSAAAHIFPLKFFRQPKAMQGRYKKDIFTIKSLQEKIPESAYPVEVNMKYDGMRVQFHKKENEIRIYSEDGGNVTERFPTFISQLKKLNDDVVLDVFV